MAVAVVAVVVAVVVVVAVAVGVVAVVVVVVVVVVVGGDTVAVAAIAVLVVCAVVLLFSQQPTVLDHVMRVKSASSPIRRMPFFASIRVFSSYPSLQKPSLAEKAAKS